MKDSVDNKIKMVCQACGESWDTRTAWSPRCALHGGPVCMICCAACEYRIGMEGLKTCTFKDPLRRHAEALRRIDSREAEENARITEAWMAKRREAARKRAIMKAMSQKGGNK